MRFNTNGDILETYSTSKLVYVLEWEALQKFGTIKLGTITFTPKQLIRLIDTLTNDTIIKDLTMFKIYAETNNCNLIIEK